MCISKSGVTEKNDFGFANLSIFFLTTVRHVHHTHISLRYMVPSYAEMYDANRNVIKPESVRTAQKLTLRLVAHIQAGAEDVDFANGKVCENFDLDLMSSDTGV